MCICLYTRAHTYIYVYIYIHIYVCGTPSYLPFLGQVKECLGFRAEVGRLHYFTVDFKVFRV